MIQQTKARIFLSDDREHNELAWFRSYNSFTFGKFQHDHKSAFGSLYALNDDTLAGNKKLSYFIPEDSSLVLIPIVGAVEYTDGNGNIFLLQAGEAQLCNLQKGSTITLSNPYENETVNFLHVWIKNNFDNSLQEFEHMAFDLETKNKLHPVFENNSLSILLGQYDGRADDIYKIHFSNKGAFTFIIDGAFEVQNRLLHARDGLALWEVSEIEFEALSNEAIILVLECNI